MKEINKNLKILENELFEMIDSNCLLEENEEKYEELSNKIKELKNLKNEIEKNKHIEDYEKKMPVHMEKFEDDVIRQLVQKITVLSKDEIEMKMNSGESFKVGF